MIKKYKIFNEVATSREQLYPKNEIEHWNKVEPALMTFDEYFNTLQKGASKSWHKDSAYNYSLDNHSDGLGKLDTKNVKLIKSIKIDKIKIDFYQDQQEVHILAIDDEGKHKRDENGELVYIDNKELNKKGKITKRYDIYAYHAEEDLVVGMAINEWGCVLVAVLNEYRNLGIGDELMDLYMHYFPHRSTGGVTNAGYNALKRYHARLVRKYLANGIYSDLVKKGEITAQRAKEVINSIDKKRYIKTGNDFSRTYGGSGEYMLYLDTNCIIIFDKDVQKMMNNHYTVDERFIKKLLKCFIYINQFKNNVDYENLFTVYGENKKFLKQGIDLLLSQGIKISDYFLNIRFDNNTKQLINSIFEDPDYHVTEEEGYKKDTTFRIISAKQIKYDFNDIKSASNKWFKMVDKHGEFKNFLMEFAESIADTNSPK